MTVSIVEKASKLGVEGGTVVVTTDAPLARARSELTGTTAKRAAIQYAADQGVADPRINGSVLVYAVDKKGTEIEDLSKAKDAVGFRADIPVTRRIL